MIKANNRNLLILIFVLSLAIIVLSSCKKQLVHNVIGAHIPKSSSTQLTMVQVEDAILEAGNSRGWIMTIIEPGLIEGKLNIRTHQAIVNIKYDEVAFDISYRNSHNLKYDGLKIHRNYNRWINYLEQDIHSYLATAFSRAQRTQQ